MEYLRQFANDGKVVTQEDITAFFQDMQVSEWETVLHTEGGGENPPCCHLMLRKVVYASLTFCVAGCQKKEGGDPKILSLNE